MSIKIIEMNYTSKAHHSFQKEMMYQAIYVPEGELLPDKDIVDDPNIIKYYVDFGTKTDDTCYIAYEKNKQVYAGAVWIRKFSKSNPSYGFVDEDTPEITLAVDYTYRGQGIGTMLINHMLKNIPSHIKKVSLSVDTDNYAYKLYKRLGFTTLSIDKGTAVMVLSLDKL